MKKNGELVVVEMSVDKLMERDVPYVNFWGYCILHDYLIPREDGSGWNTAIDMVLLTPSKNMKKNVEVWKMLDRNEVIWEDFEHYPSDPTEYDSYLTKT